MIFFIFVRRCNTIVLSLEVYHCFSDLFMYELISFYNQNKFKFYEQ